MGKRNPVTLVSAVVRRKIAVVPGNLCEANIPPTTISPLPIATKVMMTCKRVKAPTDIPRIIESLVIGLYLRNFSRSTTVRLPVMRIAQRMISAEFMDRSGVLSVGSAENLDQSQEPRGASAHLNR